MTEVSITGYQDVKKHKDNKGFTSLIKIINEKGNAVKEYQWYDTYNGSNWAGGYWRDRMDGDKKVVKVISDPTNETTASLPAGQGLWCNIGFGSSTSSVKIIWPKTDLN